MFGNLNQINFLNFDSIFFITIQMKPIITNLYTLIKIMLSKPFFN